MKKLFIALTILLFSSISANAASCSSQWTWSVGACPDYSDNASDLLNIVPQNANDGTYNYVRISQETVAAAGLTECVVGGDVDLPCLVAVSIQEMKGLNTNKFTIPTGTTSQYVRGDGTLATLPGAGSRTFNYPSRALNSCFQISSTKDSDFHYKVDVSGSLNLTSGTTGTVTATSYTNSGCSTGSQVVADGASAQSGTLVVGLGITQAASVSIDGMLPGGKWIKLTTANTVGTPTFSIRATQSEVIQP